MPKDKAAPRPPSDRGQGRHPISPSGQPMKTRAMRWSDEDWADAKFIGHDRVRDLTRKDAAQQRKHLKS